MNSLQSRLLMGFVVVLLVTVSIIGAVLLIFLGTRPLPNDALVNDLAGTSLEFITVQDAWQGQLPTSLLDEAAQDSSYRFIVISNRNQVLYDTRGSLLRGETLQLQELAPLRFSPGNRDVFSRGYFDEDRRWLFVMRRTLLGMGQGQGNRLGGSELLVAAPEPQLTPRLLLREFGTTFLIPLCQAGLVGMLVAVLLSYWIARSVARPLQAIAIASAHVAAGDYEQQVPVAGPMESQQVAHAFNVMTQQVQANQQAQRDFLANVTHELRTPLTGIQGFSQAIMDGVASEPASAQYAARIIHEEAGRLSRMVTDLLDLARIQAGQSTMQLHAVDIAQVLHTVGESLSHKAQAQGIELYRDVPALRSIIGDGDRLAQVFTNLLDNALKHTDAAGKIWLRAQNTVDGVSIEVQDTGEGIPPDDLPRIFERFYQVDKSRRRNGQNTSAGIGLAIVNEIVYAHGGRISVESQVGVGTCFRVSLPAMPPSPS